MSLHLIPAQDVSYSANGHRVRRRAIPFGSLENPVADTALDFSDNDPFFPTRIQLDLSIEQYQFGGTVEFGDDERFRPNFALTVGATRFHPAPEEIQDAWRFSVGLGGGFKQYWNDRIGLRVDGRVWPIFVNTDGGFLCSLPFGCVVSVQSDFLFQANATAGIFIAFWGACEGL